MLNRTPNEMEAFLGQELKKLRLHQNIRQEDLAKRAGVSLGALKGLESGTGSTMHTMMCLIKALGRDSWLDTVAPIASVNPLVMTQEQNPRQRAMSPSYRSAATAQPVGKAIKARGLPGLAVGERPKKPAIKKERTLVDLIKANEGHGWPRPKKGTK
jgi:hypothetical protein